MNLAKLIDAIETAVINKENLAAIKGKVITARDQANALERDYTQLQMDYDRVQNVVTKQKQEIARLQAMMTPPPPPVTAEQAPIIRCLACWTDGGDQELAEALNVPIATMKYHLDNLKSAGYATSNSYAPAYGNIWHLTTSGNAFAVQNNLGSGAPVRRRPTGPYRA